MPESTIKGKVITEPISTGDIETGTVALFKKNEEYYVITVTHMNTDGDWMVDGDYKGKVERERPFFRLSVMTEERTYPIAVRDWSLLPKEIIVTNSELVFDLIPFRYKGGKSIQTCSECSASFIASVSQPFCRKCCKEMTVARLHKSTKKEKKIDNKRPRMFKASRVRQIGLDAYDFITSDFVDLDQEDYIKWLDRQIQNGNNPS